MVNFQSYKPLDLEDTMAKGSLALAHSELAEQTDPRASLLASWLNSDENFGVTLSGSFSKRSMRQDRALTFDWREFYTGDVDSNIVFELRTPGGVRPTLEFEQRDRVGSLLSLQWLPATEYLFEMNFMGLQQEIDYEEYTLGISYGWEDLVWSESQWRDNSLVGGVVERGTVQVGLETNLIAEENYNIDTRLKHTGTRFGYELLVFDSRASSENRDPIRRTRLRRNNDVAFSFAFPTTASSQRVPSINLHNVNLNNLTTFPGRRLEWRRNDVKDRMKGLFLKANIDLFAHHRHSLEFGAGWYDHNHNYRRRDAIIEEGINGVYFESDHFSAFPVNNFLGRVDASLPRAWEVPIAEKFWSVNDMDLLREPLGARDLQNSYWVNEEITNGFVQYVYRGAAFDANAGLRVVSTYQDTAGYQEGEVPGALEFLTFSNRYNEVLPTMNINWHLTPNVDWRFAVSKALNRPNLQDLSPPANV